MRVTLTPHAVLGMIAVTAACGGGAVSGKGPGSLASPDRETERCPDSAEGGEQLAVAWPPEQRIDVELSAKTGLVVFSQRHCRLRVLRECRVRGSYSFTPITPRDEERTITTRAELEHMMPAQAAELAAEVEQPGGLRLRTALVGRYVASMSAASPADLEGDCEGATHLLASMTVGAFALESGAAETDGAGVAGTDSALARATSRRGLHYAGGDRSACLDAAAEATKPPARCSEMVRIQLVALGASGAAPGPAPVTPSSAGGFSEGSLIKGSGPEVFLIENGQRRHVPDPATFDAMGLDWGKVRTVSDEELSRVPQGEPLPTR